MSVVGEAEGAGRGMGGFTLGFVLFGAAVSGGNPAGAGEGLDAEVGAAGLGESEGVGELAEGGGGAVLARVGVDGDEGVVLFFGGKGKVVFGHVVCAPLWEFWILIYKICNIFSPQ